MRSKVAQRLEQKVPADTKIFIAKYADIVVRINELIREKGYSQKNLAENLGKKPSEISKWLNSEHNFTLRSLAKLEAELGEEIINVPQRRKLSASPSKSFTVTVHTNLVNRNTTFKSASIEKVEPQVQVA